MFKKRKPSPPSTTMSLSHSLRKAAPTSRPTTAHTPLLHKYYLQIKQSIYKLHEEKELEVLKKQDFLLEIAKIEHMLMKCRQMGEGKVGILISIFRLYQDFEVKLSTEKIVLVEELFKAVADAIIGNNAKDGEKFLIELMYADRIDQVLEYLWKCFHDTEFKALLSEKICKFVVRYVDLKEKLGKFMPKKQYQSFKTFMGFWSLQIESLQEPKQQSIASVSKSENRSSFMDKQSEPQEVYGERLRKFDQCKKNEEFAKRLNFLSAKKKPRVQRKSNLILSTSTKKISSASNNQQSQWNSSMKKDNTKKSEGNVGFSKFNMVHPRRSILSALSKDDIHKNIMEAFAHSNTTRNEVYEQPFYFYAVIKGNLRLITFLRAQLIKQTHRLRISLDGYFSYSITLNKYHDQQMECERLKKFFFSNIKLKQKYIWTILTPTFKLQSAPETDQSSKNVISELLDEDEKFTFYGFVKKFNTLFFSRYQSQSQKHESGVLSLLNLSLDEEMERITIDRWTKKENIRIPNDIEEENTEINDPLTGLLNEKGYNIVQTHFKVKLEKEKRKKHVTYKDKKISALFKFKKSNQKNIFFHTIKRDNKYFVLDQSRQNQTDTYSNMSKERQFRNIFKLETEDLGISPLTSPLLTKRYTTRAQSSFSYCNINFHSYSPILVKTGQHIKFLKRNWKLGHILFTVTIFHPCQSQLIIIDAYIHSIQKHFTFRLKSNIIDNIFTAPSPNGEATADKFNMKEWGRILLKMIKVVVKEVRDGQFGGLLILIEIGEFLIKGEELLFRKVYANDRQFVQFVEEVTINSFCSSHEKKIDMKQSRISFSRLSTTYPLIRQIYMLKSGLQVQKCQQIPMSLTQFQKLHDRHQQLKQAITGQLQKMQVPQKIFSKKPKPVVWTTVASSQKSLIASASSKAPLPTKHHFTFTNTVTKHGWVSSNLNRLVISGHSMQITKLERYSRSQTKFQVDVARLGFLKHMLGKPGSLNQYLKRVFRDHFIYHGLFQACP